MLCVPDEESTVAMSYLLDLPAELLIAISTLCSTADIKHLCETCKFLHSICVRDILTINIHTFPFSQLKCVYVDARVISHHRSQLSQR